MGVSVQPQALPDGLYGKERAPLALKAGGAR